MADHEMLNLEEMGNLKDSMELLGEELMNGHRINPNLYVEYDVKRGLRDSAGKGVLTGLTEISDVTGYDLINGRKIPAHGRLYYQGYNVNDIVDGLKGRKFGFEETIYLLLFGRLPSDKDMEIFKNIMENFETLSGRFVRDVVMKASNGDIMNAMQRCILTLYTYDSKPEDISAENVLRQSESVVGKYATADLSVGDYILNTKLSDTPAAENTYLYNLDGTKQAMSVTIKSFANGLSGLPVITINFKSGSRL